MSPQRMSDALLLRKEREENALPFSRSPFVDRLQTRPREPSAEEEHDDGELRVKAPAEVPWIDLLLEIAMTTAFASLTDGTPILHWDSALSYVCYFVFVWWIWVSQVTYNMRFRQADWLHRIWVFAQLIVFCLLAAFTKDFDVTSGLLNNPDEAAADQILTKQGFDLTGTKFRGSRLPRLNAKGVTVAMGVSRLLLLLQYTIVFHHARGLKRKSLLVHMMPLLFSALCYFAAFIVQGSTDGRPSPTADIIKLVLWYFPIIVEITSHFVSLRLPGWVKYSTESVYARSATIYLIILGSGLDKITGGFKTLIGNAGLGWEGTPVFIATAVIFIGFFSLYFGTPGSTLELGNRRALAWFYSHFFFLAALIVTLEATASSLAFTNFNTALTRSEAALDPLYQWMNDNPGLNLTTDGFNSSESLFNKLGIGLDYIVGNLNYIASQNDSSIVATGQLSETMWVFYYILTIFDALPDGDSLLWANLVNFLDATLDDTTTINRATFESLYDGILKERGSSALWLYPAAGATILALVLMSFVKGAPRDGWEWCVIISRIFVGGAVCLLALLDIGSSKPIFDGEGKLTSCIIWVITVGPNRMLLVILAVAMGVLQIIEHSIAYAANRPYHTFPSLNFLFKTSERRPTGRQSGPEYHYRRTQSNVDVIPLRPNLYSDKTVTGSMYTNPYDSFTYDMEFNPYHEFDASGSTIYHRGG